jgi:hypothetical protein
MLPVYMHVHHSLNSVQVLIIIGRNHPNLSKWHNLVQNCPNDDVDDRNDA